MHQISNIIFSLLIDTFLDMLSCKEKSSLKLVIIDEACAFGSIMVEPFKLFFL